MNVPVEIAVAGAYLFIRRDVPVVFWGAGGIGKSSIVKSIVKILGRNYHETRPYHIKKALESGSVEEVFPKDSNAIWFMDEIVAGGKETEMVQIALYEIILDRRFGVYRVPEGVRIVGASNRRADDAGVSGFLSPLRTRVGHFEIQASRDFWLSWALGRDRIKEIVEKVHEYCERVEENRTFREARKKFRIDPRIVLFLANAAGEDYFIKSSSATSYGQPAPRSWELCSKVIFGISSVNLIRACVGACVGKSALLVFDGFLRSRNLYEFEEACDELERRADEIAPCSSFDVLGDGWNVYA